MSTLSWKVTDQNEVTRVELSGEITEESDFSPLLTQAKGPLVVDLAQVTRINSCGVREWINFVGQLGKSGNALALERCSPPIVQQLNMISNFRGEGEVRSVYAPYYCPDCNHEEARLVELSKDAPPEIEETMDCPKCGSEMEFDDLPEAYLSFLQE